MGSNLGVAYATGQEVDRLTNEGVVNFTGKGTIIIVDFLRLFIFDIPTFQSTTISASE